MVQLLLAIIYLAFISLGLPDALLGAAWPTMQPEFGVPLSYAGIVSMIIAVGTVVSSLQSDRLTRRAVALLGFSFTKSFWLLCLWAVPYGLGAGSVDAALNNYVALHFKSRHMSWLHCMWGIGATLGPYVMGYALTGGNGWHAGYQYIGILQVVLSVILWISLPLWKRQRQETAQEQSAGKALSLREIVQIPGAKAVMACFFGYCALEQSTSLWASSYLTLQKGVSPETAASFASMFFIGITAGRALCGFITMKFTDPQMIRAGLALIAAGIVAMLLPGGQHRPGLRADLSLHHPFHARALRRGALASHHRRANGQRLCRYLPDAAAVRPDCQPHFRGAAAGLFAAGAGAHGDYARNFDEKSPSYECARGLSAL